jgi:hypothetical protein
MDTFIKEEQAHQLAGQAGLNKDEVWKYLNLSQGNWQEISRFILQEKDNPRLFPFLATLSEKDLRDTPAEYLNDFFYTDVLPGKNILDNTEITESYIFSPRIEREFIKPWKSFFQQQNEQDNGDKEKSSKGVQSIIDYVKDRIKISDEENYYYCRITPRGVYELRIADRPSRDIFFVALCRSSGIPARIEASTGKPQYFNGQWTDVVFDPVEQQTTNLPKTRLTVKSASTNVIKPGYYTHYTLACFKDGDFQTLDFEENPVVNQFPYSLDLDEGYYRLMVGSRANDGSVFVHTQYFELKGNKPFTLNIGIGSTILEIIKRER